MVSGENTLFSYLHPKEGEDIMMKTIPRRSLCWSLPPASSVVGSDI